MTELDRLYVRFNDGIDADAPVDGRSYTLTHSDISGDLFLAVGRRYDDRALRALQVRLERDEVLAQWVRTETGWTLELHMMAQGGLPLFGTGSIRCNIFRHFRPMVLRALRQGDAEFLTKHPELEEAPIIAWFHWRRRPAQNEPWGRLADWS